jgi:hypothetical protein
MRLDAPPAAPAAQASQPLAAPPLPASLQALLAAAAAQQPPAAALPPPAPPLKECCVCLEDVPQPELWMLLPCAHRCVCDACAARLMSWPVPARKCPKCREPVTRTSRVFED